MIALLLVTGNTTPGYGQLLGILKMSWSSKFMIYTSKACVVTFHECGKESYLGGKVDCMSLKLISLSFISPDLENGLKLSC